MTRTHEPGGQSRRFLFVMQYFGYLRVLRLDRSPISRARASRGCRLRQSAQTARGAKHSTAFSASPGWVRHRAATMCGASWGRPSAERSTTSAIFIRSLRTLTTCVRECATCFRRCFRFSTLAIRERQHDEASDRAVSRVRARDSEQPNPRSVPSFARARCVARDAVGHGQVHASGPRQERSSAWHPRGPVRRELGPFDDEGSGARAARSGVSVEPRAVGGGSRVSRHPARSHRRHRRATDQAGSSDSRRLARRSARRLVSIPRSRSSCSWIDSIDLGARAEVGFVRRWIEALRRVPALADVGARPASSLQRIPLARYGSDEDAHVEVYPKSANPVNEADRQDYFDSLFHSEAVVGVNTTAMVEAAIQGRTVHAVLADEFQDTQGGTLHFRYLLSENGGFLRVAKSPRARCAARRDACQSLAGS